MPPSVGSVSDIEADCEPSLSDASLSVALALSLALFEFDAEEVAPPLSPQAASAAVTATAPATLPNLRQSVCTQPGYAAVPDVVKPTATAAQLSRARASDTLSRVTVYYWDYYGPDAEGTARHFLVHLHEYLARAGLADCERGVESVSPNHWAVWCKASGDAREAMLRLRPRRAAPA
jgi:hypothetical protein